MVLGPSWCDVCNATHAQRSSLRNKNDVIMCLVPGFPSYPPVLQWIYSWGAGRAWEQSYYSSTGITAKESDAYFLFTTGVEATWFQDVVVLCQFDSNTSTMHTHTHTRTHMHTHCPVLSQYCHLVDPDWLWSLWIILSDDTCTKEFHFTAGYIDICC